MARDLTVLVRLKANANDYVRGMVAAAAATRGLLNEIDKTNDRTAWLAQGLLAIGPALVPIGAAAVPALAGLTMQLGLAVAAAGVAALAFNGIGDGLKALNDYQLEPTAKNLEKLELALEKVGPAGEQFIRYLDSIGDELTTLQMAAREGMFPGVEDGIRSMMTMLPQVRNIITEIAEGMGQLAREGGAGLAGAGFSDFFDYLESEAQPLLLDMGRTMGGFAEGLAAMVVAFDPLTQRFSEGFLQMSRDFAEWAHGLEDSQSFADFIAYVESAIPMVSDFIGSLVDAFVQLVEAAAPVGDVMLPVLTQLLDLFGQFLDSPLGPVFIGLAAALSVYGRAAALAAITTGGMVKHLFPATQAMIAQRGAIVASMPTLSQWGTAMMRAGQGAQYQSAQTQAAMTAVKGFTASILPGVGAIGLMVAAMTDLDDKMGLANTAMLGFGGAAVGGGIGAAVGTAAGLMMDAAAANNDFAASLERARAVLQQAPADFDRQTASLAEMRHELVEFANPDNFFSALPAQGKNLVEGIFGDSDVEEMLADLKAVEEQVDGNRLAWASLTDALGGWEGPSTQIDDLATLAETAERAGPAMETLGITLSDLQNADPGEYRELVAAIEEQIDAEFELANGASRAALAIERKTAAMRAARAEALRAENAELAYAAAQLDARDAAKEHGNVLSRTGELLRGQKRAGIEAKTALLQLAESWNSLSDAEKSQAGARRAAINGFVEVAHAMGMSRDEARKYARALFEIPKKVETKTTNDTSQAFSSANAWEARLRDLDGQRADTYTYHHIVTTQDFVQGGSTPHPYDPSGSGGGRADGGPIYGVGGPRQDNIPIWASNGEFMISAESRQYYERLFGDSFFFDLNNRRLAAGGPVNPDARPLPAMGGAGSGGGIPRELAIVGTLDTPFGPAQVRGIAREAVAEDRRASARAALIDRNT